MSNNSDPELNIILIVDDNPNNLAVLSDFLDESGFEIRVARDGESALEKVNYAPPDLILLDVMMPGIDGFEACRQLKSNPETEAIPVIFMTALSDTVDKVKGLELGAVDYITKPFSQEEVLARVRLHLRLRKMAEKLAEQNEMLKQEIEEKNRAEVALQGLTQELEQRVNERTAELQQALIDLQDAQVQLVQNEKMSTLGQLVAGVAHEINNPVGFIMGNLSHAQQYIQDIIEHLNLYQKCYPEPDLEIQDHYEEIELDFLLKDLPDLIGSMHEGTDRIRNISRSLRTFSRSDITSKVSSDIHEGIDSTLLILKHRLKATQERPAIAIIKKYGDVPEITCYPGQLNQVFMNLLANAIDALDESNQGRTFQEIESNPNQITIQTQLSPSQREAIITIEDNGKGIPEEIRNKIFDHLYTTKAYGQGTGLGLSISRQIVEEKHGGKLTCHSASVCASETEFYRGCIFTITLPIT
ncbi:MULTISPECIES: response regulator [unclassified Roseofilum]|uniref:hybrid sensor histidine kinase/response regulator n=1 Tax=unclassified Roseofilum TaxID=2620099 RepID=UPI000E862619|nr:MULTISPECIES: response regulator [unclassified Roseofilum]MBP0009989.1 response regulator [Roseofilum sp. Belize Diploria]MBP0034113.1 response regulator [Roseofilum sp. Belize BBD 4]HBQ97035.1 hybrid sensor histidine kinase/response regulator [Cyanobacteria bacterium UBA11691]